MTARKPVAAEFALIRRLLEFGHREDLALIMQGYQVEPLADGGMGSLRFIDDAEHRRFGTVVAKAITKDIDGTPISLSLNLDTEGRLFELDIWKVDFSPLIALPDAASLKKEPT